MDNRLDYLTECILATLIPLPKDIEFNQFNYDYVSRNDNEVTKLAMMMLEALDFEVYYASDEKLFLVNKPVVH
jgi:hypothetical protein